MSIRIRALKLVGDHKDYDVGFVRDGLIRPLAVVAGEILTGKTSVLEFVEYCLGAKDHPRHQEIQRRVQAARLEVDLSGEVVVIERATFSEQGVAYVHHCSLDELHVAHHRERKVIEPAGAEDSLSMLLLEHCGLAGIPLKEAPTKADSPTHPLSFRDLLWLCFLENPRLDSGHLLFEGNFMKQLKLRQVIEVVFGVHDDQLAKLGEQLKTLQLQRVRREAALKSLEAFFEENKVPERLELVAGRETVASELRQLEGRLGLLDQRMRADTEFAMELRSNYSAARAAAGRLANSVRYNETLLQRLLPLRGQYAEDERKLHFFAEAKTLFDPLRIEFCPSCQQALPQAADISGGHCTLCGQGVESGDEPIEVKAEIRAVRARRQEIDRYIDEVEGELTGARREYAQAAQIESEAQSELDARVAEQLSPFIAEREQVVRLLEGNQQRDAEIASQLGWYAGVERRQLEIQRLDDQLDRLQREIAERRESRRTRDELVEELSERYGQILRAFRFPKVADPDPPHLDKNFVPWARGVSYANIGSSGAMTLISLAWQLAIFELAIEGGHPHPGFLMIDSPQKNLTPEGMSASDEFGDPAIGAHVWDYLLSVSDRFGVEAQLIVVDNKPRAQAEEAVVEDFTGGRRPGRYGLIDDETR